MRAPRTAQYPVTGPGRRAGTSLWLALALGLAACGAEVSAAKTGPGGPVPVGVVTVVAQPVTLTRELPGRTSAYRVAEVRARVNGIVQARKFSEGSDVKAGDVLFEIDSAPYQATLAGSRASLARAESNLAAAKLQATRVAALSQENVASAEEQESTQATLKAAEADAAAARASVKTARITVGYTKVTAPITGIAGIRAVDAGNVVNAGTALVTLTQIHPIHVLFNLPERQLGDVRQAQAAGSVPVAALDRADSHVLSGDGKLDVVDNLISADSGTFKARAVFDNTDNGLWPGQFVNVRMQLRTIGGGVVIPTQAVLRGPDGEYVYVVQGDNTVKMQTVRSGVEVGDSQVQIAEGLKGGERVVSEGQFRLKPGSKVTALKPGETPAAPTEAELKAAEQKSGGGRRGGGPR